MIKNIIVTMFVALITLVSPQAKSATITNSITYYDHQTVDSWYTDSTNILYVPHFNPQIGTLLNAKVYLKLNITNKFAFENRQDVSFANPDFIGTIWVTNTVSFGGIEVLKMNVTNTFDATRFDGIDDFGGTSGFTTTNILNKNVVFDVAAQDVAGYSVWQAKNESSARSLAVMYSGNLRYAVMTTSGVDIWAVYTYTTQCPDCDKDKDCDKDSDKDEDKDKDKNRKSKRT